MKFALGFAVGVVTTVGAVYGVAANADILVAVCQTIDEQLAERRTVSAEESKRTPPTTD